MVLLFWFPLVEAQELGEVLSADDGIVTIYIGKEKIQPGELITVRNSKGVKDIQIEITEVKGTVARGRIFKFNRSALMNGVETLNKKRRAILKVDDAKKTSFSFLVGPSFSKKVGEYGGSNYGLGLSGSGPLSFWKKHGLRWSMQLQADDLGKDSYGNEKRVSYYMFGLGKEYHGFHLYGHLGLADNMTMPKEKGSTVVDPMTGAVYPDNVEHSNYVGYLFTARYPFVMKKVSRNNLAGWSLSPYLTYGGAFSSRSYKETLTVAISVDINLVD